MKRIILYSHVKFLSHDLFPMPVSKGFPQNKMKAGHFVNMGY